MTLGDLIEDVLDKNDSDYFGNMEKEIGSINTVLTQNPALSGLLSKPISSINTSLQSYKAYIQAREQQKQQADLEAKKAQDEKMKADAQKSRLTSSSPGTRRELPGEKMKGLLGPQVTTGASNPGPSK